MLFCLQLANTNTLGSLIPSRKKDNRNIIEAVMANSLTLTQISNNEHHFNIVINSIFFINQYPMKKTPHTMLL